MKFNKEKLNTGDCDQFTVVNHMGYRIGIHYSSWRTNPWLAKHEIRKLENLPNIDPTRAEVATFGMPGIEHGAIYAHHLHKITDITKLPKSHFVFNYDRIYLGGVDWGVVNDSAVVQLWASDPDSRWVVGLKRNAHSNKPKSYNDDYTGEYKDNIQLEQWVINSYINWD